MEHRRLGRLSEGQIECLVMVHEHLTSKEIAAQLGISSHTVDQRIRQSLQILGVGRRAVAAQIVVAGALHGRPRIDDAPTTEVTDIAERKAFPVQLPFATKTRPTNTMSVATRLMWIVAIAMGATLSAGMYLAGLESLSRMLRNSHGG